MFQEGERSVDGGGGGFFFFRQGKRGLEKKRGRSAELWRGGKIAFSHKKKVARTFKARGAFAGLASTGGAEKSGTDAEKGETSDSSVKKDPEVLLKEGGASKG